MGHRLQVPSLLLAVLTVGVMGVAGEPEFEISRSTVDDGGSDCRARLDLSSSSITWATESS